MRHVLVSDGGSESASLSASWLHPSTWNVRSFSVYSTESDVRLAAQRRYSIILLQTASRCLLAPVLSPSLAMLMQAAGSTRRGLVACGCKEDCTFGNRVQCAHRPAPASCSACSNGGTVITTFTSVLIGASSISQLGVLFGAFAAAQVAAFELYAIIDRVPSIDPRSDSGEKPPRDRVLGRVEFRNVTFAYPSREFLADTQPSLSHPTLLCLESCRPRVSRSP
jgi:ABC-type multidrug transport system fused ATPase/permease subunit